MGESWPRSPVQIERSEVCTSDRGQDSPIQTDLARLIRCLLYGKTRNQGNKNINNFICFPVRAQAFSWLSSVTGLQSKRDKKNCSKPSFVQTSSMSEDKIFHLDLENSLSLRMLTRLAGSRLKYPARTQGHFVYKRRWKIWTKEGRAPWQVCFQLL